MKDKVQDRGILKLNNSTSFFTDDAVMLGEDSDFEERKLPSANPTIKSSWVRVMPGLHRNDVVRVREYGDISVPSRIRVINNNTYDILLENGEEKNGVRREEIWLNPELELKFSALSVDLLQENQEIYDKNNNEGVYPPDPMLRKNERESPNSEQDYRHVLIRLNDFGEKDPTSGKRIAIARIIKITNGDKSEMIGPGLYHDDFGLIPYTHWKYDVEIVNCPTPSCPDIRSFLGNVYTNCKRGYDIQAYYPLPPFDILSEYDITEIDAVVFTKNEFRPAHSREYGLFPSVDNELELLLDQSGDESTEEDETDEEVQTESKRVDSKLGKDICKVQFNLEQLQLPSDDLISMITERRLKRIHKFLDSRQNNSNLEGFRFADKAKILKVHNDSLAMPYDYQYDIEFENGLIREKVSALELWPCKYDCV